MFLTLQVYKLHIKKMLRILLGKSANTRESANCFIRFKIVIQDQCKYYHPPHVNDLI